MKNKILALLLIAVLLVSLLASCNFNKHTHDFSGAYSNDDTYHWHECSCGEKGATEQHSWNSGVVTLNPTADTEGERTFTCTVCRAQKIEKIDKLGENHTHAYTIAGSDENYHWNECICGEKEEKAEHSWDEGKITLYPTVEAEGVRTYTCTVCSFEKDEAIEKLDPDHSHAFDTSASDEHNHWNECICGAKDAVAGHSWNEGEITTPAGEVEAGVKTYTCTECGRKSTEIIRAQSANGLSFLQSTHYRISDTFEKTPLSLEAEIYVDPSVSGRAGAIFGNYYGIRQDWLFEIHENGVPRFYYTDAAGNVKDYKFSQVDVRTGDWVHIALTFDFENGTINLYLDGEIAQIIICEADLASDITRYQFVLGGDNRSNNGIYFKGQIRSLAAYSDVRTAEEIAESCENGVNLYADDLIVSYLLSENNAGNDIKDLSGNGYDIPKEWIDSHEPTLDYAYSFAVIGDTQWLSKYMPEKMEGIYDWILENQESKKISHVFGLGDITEDWNTAGKEQEWIRAQQYISKLNGIVPYSLVRGNHDESKYFLKYFATEEYMNQYDGGYMVEGDIRNTYKAFTVGTTDYLLITLDYGPSDEALEWANEVVLDHPNHRVIVTTHAYQSFDGYYTTYDNSFGDITYGGDVDYSVGEPVRSYNNGQAIWDKFVSKHPNIFLVMGGHNPMDDVVMLQSEGNHGNIVTQLLIDPQWMDPQKDGVGMVCMLYFSEDGTQLEYEWISTDTGKYYKEMNQSTIDISGSFGISAHEFYDSYDAKSHHLACDCGYTYNEEPHKFDGGVLNSEGFMVYSCACGYQRIASATNDPVALELQAIIEKYYNNGVYFKSTNGYDTFYSGDKFWTTDDADCKSCADYLTLYDFIMGKRGDLKLDLGWNYYEGVYSSSNASTLDGAKQFVEIDNSAINKVTVETKGSTLIIKLWADDNVITETTVGYYATTTLVKLDGEIIDVIYTKAGNDNMCVISAPSIDGYVAEYDKIILDVRHNELARTVYYSTVDVWDGVSVSASLKGSGTADDPYLVESGADLAYIAGVVNSAAAKTPNFSGKYFKMTQSIDLGGHELYIGSYTGWSTRKGFYGFFDGNHCTVRGLNSSRSLFGTIENGYLKDLSVYGTINSYSDEATGGIVGYVANSGRLENLTSYVTLNGVKTLGGIVGNAENNASTVINCVNYGNVTGSSWNIGGIAGSGGHDVIGCVNFGNVESTGSDNVGGIAGSTKNTGSISDCYNYGNVKTVHGRSGGIVGLGTKPIINCVNYGNVTAGWDSGGILGYVGDGASASVIDCINNGTITGNTGIGGIFGFNHANAGSIIITGCVNNGDVTGTWGVGGIAGNTKAEISGCVNNGTLNAKGELGGIVGKCYGKVTECTNSGRVIGVQDIIGGIVGHLHVATYVDEINSTNYQQGTVTGPNSKEIIGKQG